MTLEELDKMRKEECLLCSKYYYAIGWFEQATKDEMYFEICKPNDCFLEEFLRGKNDV